MGIGAVSSLREFRSALLGFSEEAVVRHSGIRFDRLKEIEKGAGTPLSVWEADALSRLYGVDEEVLTSTPFHVPWGEAVSTLACMEEFREIGDSVRARIVATARAAKDLVTLRDILGIQQPPVPRLAPGPASEVPWRDGKAIAERARMEIGPRDQNPILSVRDWMRDYLPGVPVLYAKLGDFGPAGLTFAGEKFGPAIVLNLDGKNVNPCVRRFSLAHEVYHLLVDWNRNEPLATLSGYLEDAGFEREQRANSFAIRFQCPEANLRKLPVDDGAAATVLMTKWGLHYGAARLYLLNNKRGKSLDPVLPPGIQVTGAESGWTRSEDPDGLAAFPIPETPLFRRTLVARLAATAYSRGMVQRDRFADLLGVTPDQDLESVLALYGFDPPSEFAAA